MESVLDPVTTVQAEIWHKDYNLSKKDTLNELPDTKAVFGIFAIVNDAPINCRYTGETENLRNTIRDLFENPPETGLQKFMQGPWIKMIQYEAMPDSPKEQRQQEAQEWTRKHDPKIDADGEYPGYYF